MKLLPNSDSDGDGRYLSLLNISTDTVLSELTYPIWQKDNHPGYVSCQEGTVFIFAAGCDDV